MSGHEVGSQAAPWPRPTGKTIESFIALCITLTAFECPALEAKAGVLSPLPDSAFTSAPHRINASMVSTCLPCKCGEHESGIAVSVYSVFVSSILHEHFHGARVTSQRRRHQRRRAPAISMVGVGSAM